MNVLFGVISPFSKMRRVFPVPSAVLAEIYLFTCDAISVSSTISKGVHRNGRIICALYGL